MMQLIDRQPGQTRDRERKTGKARGIDRRSLVLENGRHRQTLEPQHRRALGGHIGSAQVGRGVLACNAAQVVVHLDFTA